MKRYSITILVVVVGICVSSIYWTGCTDEGPSGSMVGPDTTGTGNPSGYRSYDDLLEEVAQSVPNFGGMYITDDGAFEVVMVDAGAPTAVSAESARDAIGSVFGPEMVPAGSVRVRKGQYTFLQLKQWYDEARPEVLALSGVVLTDIDERTNRLSFGVEDVAAQRDVERTLKSLSVPLEAVTIEVTRPIEVDLNQRRRPLMGGLGIARNSTLGHQCTLGIIADRHQGSTHVRGFVTCSHCTGIRGAIDNSVFYQTVMGTGNRVGVETVDSRMFTRATNDRCPSGMRCAYSDAAFVRLDAAVTSRLGNFARVSLGSTVWNGRDLYGIYNWKWFPPSGAYVGKVGATTGLTKGKITRTCVDVPVRNTNIVMLCQSTANYSSAGGDSGSPVFDTSITQCSEGSGGWWCGNTLYGIHWGGDWGSGGSTSVFSPMIWVSLELGGLHVSP